MRGILAATLAVAILAIPQGLKAQAGTQNVYSANFILPGCKTFIGSKAMTFDEAYNMGTCWGILSALVFVDRQLGFCAPKDATGDQAARVVIAYVESRPARMHEPFNELALEALRQAWPCP